MGTITSGVGLISGINSRDIIDQLMRIESRSKDLLQARIDKANQQKLAYTDLSTRLTSLRISATTLKKPSTFTQAITTSSNEAVLTATAGPGAAVGSYQFQVARLVTSQQSVTRGFSSDKAKVGAGTITLEMGGGDLKKQSPLSSLRGGEGIRRGAFRITDRSGKSATIDISTAVTLEDVVKKINTSLDLGVRASIGKEGLTLTDISGGSGTLVVQDMGDGHAAEDLGIANSVANTSDPSKIVGADINFLGRDVALASLNDGRGIRQVEGNDFTITVGDTVANFDLGDAKTIGDVIELINNHPSGALQAEASDNGLIIRDLTGSGAISVTAMNGSNAAADLGILGDVTGDTLTGGDVLGAMNSVSLASLDGGRGLTLGKIRITDREGNAAEVDLSGAKTVQDVLDTITNASAIRVTASLNAAGNGIQLTDNTGKTGAFTVEEVDGGDSAEKLGLLGTFNANTINGKNLQRQWVTEATTLASYNGGKGVGLGKFRITNAQGVSADIEITENEKTLGDVIRKINARNIGITASINENGDGLLLTDTSGGAGKMKVAGVSGTTAKDLRIEGAAEDNRIDGSFEVKIEVSATDTLTDVQKKINDLGFGAYANILNDGSGAAPYRLSITARNAGANGQFVFDAGSTLLAAQTLVEAQDAAVFVGGTDVERPLLVTAAKNQIAGVIPGVTIDLHSASTSPVTLNISSTPDKAIETITKFTETFNELTVKIKELTAWDAEKNKGGLLLGDTTIRRMQTEIYTALNTVVPDAGKYRVLSQIGLRISNGVELEFDEEKFREAYASDPESVNKLFTALTTGFSEDMPLAKANNNVGIRKLGNGQNDFKITTKDGSEFEISLDNAVTVGDVLTLINGATGGKVKAEIPAAGQGIRLTDTTSSGTGTGSFQIQPLGGSQAAFDLGFMSTPVNGVITGKSLGTAAAGGGVASALEAAINKLIDPVSGVVTRENQKLDSQTEQIQDRIESLDKLLENKRARLERQFIEMERVLANLSSQQQSLGSIQLLQMSSNK